MKTRHYQNFMYGSILAIIILVVVWSVIEKRIPTNEEKAIDWIFLAPKPIVCYPYHVNYYGRKTTNYTLVNSEAGVYMTGPIKMMLPDTIK